MESTHALLDDMRHIYGESEAEGAIKICSLARVCQQLLIILEEEEEDGHNMYPEIHTQILKYLLQMSHILREEKNDKRKVMAGDILSKLTDRLI